MADSTNSGGGQRPPSSISAERAAGLMDALEIARNVEIVVSIESDRTVHNAAELRQLLREVGLKSIQVTRSAIAAEIFRRAQEGLPKA